MNRGAKWKELSEPGATLLPEIGLLQEKRNGSSFLCVAAGAKQSGRK
jgi:hypothetical protein